MKKIIFYTAIVGLLSACIGEDIINDTQLMNERLSIVSNMSSADTLLVGDSLQLVAEFYGIDGELTGSSKVWESSRPEIASISQSGNLVGLAEGVSNIVVSSNGLKDQRLVIVRQLERIEIVALTQATVFVGDSISLAADYYNKEGVLETIPLTWSVDDNSIASVNVRGNQVFLKGNVAGAVKVKAQAKGVEGELNITVIDDTAAAATILLHSNTSTLMVGETTQFTAQVRTIAGKELPNALVNYTSSDNSVLTIDNNGLATAIGPGSAAVQAMSENALSNNFSILVSQAVTTSRTGVFSGSGGYSVSGNVTMRVDNGNLVLDFVNFSSSNGPGLYIYLGNSPNSGISVEALNRRNGNFSVSLPSSISIDDYNYVIIWCQPFGLTFGSAQLN